MSEPLLSFCFYGRNDNYSPDFIYRLSTTINFLAESADHLGRLQDIEIVVVDWASQAALKDAVQLSTRGATVSRFIMADRELADRFQENVLPGNLCANIALRRATGQLVTICGAEVLVPSTSLASLFAVLEGKTTINHPLEYLYVCGRYRLPIEWVVKQPKVEQWQNYLLKRDEVEGMKEHGKDVLNFQLTMWLLLFIFAIPPVLIIGIFILLYLRKGWNEKQTQMSTNSIQPAQEVRG